MSELGEYFVPTAAYTKQEFARWEELEQLSSLLLATRTRELRLPEIPFQPTDDDVMVYRLQAKEQKTEGGIVIPDHTLDVDEGRTIAHQKVINLGLLLKAGCTARDWMRSHGVLIGDIVKWGKYSGEETPVHWFTGGTVRSMEDVLLLNVRDIRGSFDLDTRLWGPEQLMKIVFVADDAGRGMHLVKPVT
jgi:co-chaperonin GroES (HSP10)